MIANLLYWFLKVIDSTVLQNFRIAILPHVTRFGNVQKMTEEFEPKAVFHPEALWIPTRVHIQEPFQHFKLEHAAFIRLVMKQVFPLSFPLPCSFVDPQLEKQDWEALQRSKSIATHCPTAAIWRLQLQQRLAFQACQHPIPSHGKFFSPSLLPLLEVQPLPRKAPTKNPALGYIGRDGSSIKSLPWLCAGFRAADPAAGWLLLSLYLTHPYT